MADTGITSQRRRPLARLTVVRALAAAVVVIGYSTRTCFPVADPEVLTRWRGDVDDVDPRILERLLVGDVRALDAACVCECLGAARERGPIATARGVVCRHQSLDKWPAVQPGPTTAQRSGVRRPHR